MLADAHLIFPELVAHLSPPWGPSETGPTMASSTPLSVRDGCSPVLMAELTGARGSFRPHW